MRHYFILFFCFCYFILPAQELSENAEISVLTIAPGASLNDAFGHSAFRIQDDTNHLDLVFNYGVYDFEAPNFILKFAQGKLNYLIGLNRFNDFYRAYTGADRGIKQQTLNLTYTEKQKLFSYLIENYKPENRRYLYDFLFDNCATRIKDVVNVASNNTIKYNIPKNYEEATFRTLIQENLNRNSWGSLGIDIALGAVVDRKATPEEHMFLPKNIYTFFEKATKTDDETSLVKESKILFQETNQNTTSNFLLSPLFIFGLLGLLIAFITYKDNKNNKRTKILDIIIFALTGLAGVFILLLWFATDHQTTHNNYNLLWANPLNFILLFQLFKRNMSNWFAKYLKFQLILLCLMAFHWITGVQIFAIGLIPLLIAISIRYIYLIKYLKVHNTIAP
ncbi:lipoprotein N-acyltransferase Lnb domain-containing protein [Hyunsoonleella pacifica]|uniref:DUF4105 domain-containing protein n=1 Tax=Hyunsoonleella pacifica TaxID=1080224 RepID=A0A4Q9FVJ5_9FLAO|nr:DUF4105 domain-containing protein [Hyunsoonleella pacifica]TBN18532.1 DUF4105 domain-containing protein [Hyunsoonleella pacifica]GGD02568.1 hypothetical protein GCM10011368_00490 [Hyunsoonleella pacifica]